MLFSLGIQGSDGASRVKEHSRVAVVIHLHSLVIIKIFNSLVTPCCVRLYTWFTGLWGDGVLGEGQCCRVFGCMAGSAGSGWLIANKYGDMSVFQ